MPGPIPTGDARQNEVVKRDSSYFSGQPDYVWDSVDNQWVYTPLDPEKALASMEWLSEGEKAIRRNMWKELRGRANVRDTAAKESAGAEEEYQTWRKGIMVRLDAFAKEMSMPIQELIARGDLGVINAGNAGLAASSSAAYGAGLGDGGVSTMNTQRAVTDAQSGYQLQRAGLGLQGYNSLLNTLGEAGREREDKRQYEQKLDLELQQADEAMRQRRHAEGSGTLSTGLGIVGGAAGALLTRTPQGAMAGYGLGSGLGGLVYGQYKPRPMKYPSGYKQRGGANPYSGSQ